MLDLLSGLLNPVLASLALLGLVGLAVWGLLRAFWDQRESTEDERLRELRGVPCPYCKGTIDREDLICSHCYRDLKANCPECGETVSLQAKHCPHCRTELEVPSAFASERPRHR